MLKIIEKWFQEYTNPFYTDDTHYNRNISLKVEHCIRVSKIMADIAIHENCTTEELEIAQIVGLLHDIGRFEQYKQFQTFADHKSFDHGDYGVTVLKNTQCLQKFPIAQQHRIYQAIHLHNKAQMPSNEKMEVQIMTKMVRDADKIDIFQLSYEYFKQRTEKNKNMILELHLSECEEITDSIYNSIMDGKLAMMRNIQTLNDFKALQIGWIFDINCKRSFEIIHERKALNKLFSTIPTPNIKAQNIYQKAEKYLSKKTAPSPILH